MAELSEFDKALNEVITAIDNSNKVMAEASKLLRETEEYKGE